MGNKRKNRSAPSAAATTDDAVPELIPAETESEAAVVESLFLGQHTLSTRYFQHSAVALSAVIIAIFVYVGYRLRVSGLAEFGALLRNSDPWFNYRATEYMSEHGWTAFFRWFDYMSWYPLGRPVGSTTYPGLQFTAVAIHRALAALGVSMSLNDVCVLIPAWFSVVATLLVALLAHETAQSLAVTVVSAALFPLLPAYVIRSMAGEFDNECVAVPAMLLTFYLWVRSLRTPASWPIGALAGVAYGYMAATWGGYIFVLNMVALHAGVSSMVDWARNTYSPALLRSYALFYVIGTALATRVPPVGMAPFNSLEQLGALVVLLFLCSQCVCEYQRVRANVGRFSKRGVALLIRAYAACFVLMMAAALCAPEGFIKPLSLQASRLVRGVSQTGNPLVDIMLAEDSSNLVMAWQMLLFPFFGGMIGLSAFLSSMAERYTHAKGFLMLYGVAGVYFSTQAIRMIVMVAPTACIFTGVVVQWALIYARDGFYWPEFSPEPASEDAALTAEEAAAALQKKKEEWTTKNSRRIMLRVLPLMAFLFVFRLSGFVEDVNMLARQLAAPGIIFRSRPSSELPEEVIDDYYRSFLWLRDNTPQDARVLAWFDYGYQITGIGNRTSLADGNTWNHEHIATIGKMLTSPVAEAHSLVRHVADYVLIFAGSTYFSDVDRSPLLAQMANTVYHDICPNDPLCRKFGFQKKQKAAPTRRSRHMLPSELDLEEADAPVEYEPTPLLARSLLYHLHANGTDAGVALDDSKFELAFSSERGLVRIYKVLDVSEESKRWSADRANRVCSPPGSWVCPGQYPPAPEIQAMLARQQPNYQDVVDAYREVKAEEAMNGGYAADGSDL